MTTGIEWDTVDFSGVELRPCPKRGQLVFWNLPDEIQRLEDGLQDLDYRARNWRASVHMNRPARPVEVALLRHIGFDPPANLYARIQWLSSGVRRRTFPQIPATLEGLDPA